MSVYGQGPFESIFETDIPNPQTELAKTRREAEILVEMKCKELGIPGFLLRPRFIFGECDRSSLPSLQKLSTKSFRIGNEKQKLSFINVDDYAKIISVLAGKTKTGDCEALNIGYSQPATLESILDQFSKGRDKNSFEVPVGLVMTICGLSKKLKSVRTKLELIGQSHVLNTRKLQNLAGDLVSEWNSQQKLETAVSDFMGVNDAVEN